MHFKIKIMNFNSVSQLTAGIHSTPWGTCLITQCEEALCGLVFCNHDKRSVLQSLGSSWPQAQICYSESETKSWATLAIQSLSEKIKTDKAETLAFIGTPFQISVWNALLELEIGEVCTYQDIAIRIGHPKAIRAVGNAVGKNPISLLVPCHRVLRKNGDIGGYAWGIDRKRLLLDYEKNSTKTKLNVA